MHAPSFFCFFICSYTVGAGAACGNSTQMTTVDAASSVDAATPANSPFQITVQSDADFASLPKKTSVFEIPIYGAMAVEDSKMLHAANVMAQYLDNDADGVIDNPQLVETMKEGRAFLVTWKSESDLNFDIPTGIGQDLGADETVPQWHVNHSGRFDASLEEVLHLITHAGYARLHPTIFGEVAGTQLADAMDIARGGHFQSIPMPYPAGAWYSYDDQTCDYACMVSEYHYWALTSILGAQADRLDEISQEWTLNTSEKVSSTDTAVFSLLSAPEYHFATTLPDGKYNPQ